MHGQTPKPLVRSDKPLKPEHSLPSYYEPTPETHRRLSREDEAELALKNTIFTPGTRVLLVMLFLVTITIVPVIQFTFEFRESRSNSGRLPMFDALNLLPNWAKVCAVRSPIALWHLLPRADEIKSVEKTLENESVVSQWLLPHVQSVLTGRLGAGNEQAYTGRKGWLFYRPDVDYVIGPAFLDPTRMKQRARSAGVQPDPVKAIVDFRNQLAAREIKLVVIAVPVKPSIDGEMLSARARTETALQNASFAEFKTQLEKEGVRLFDPTPLLMERKAAAGGAPLYLETDTHWRPETMEFIAHQLAVFLDAPPAARSTILQVSEKEVSALGDIAKMLRLPPTQSIYFPQKVTIRQVTAGNALWQPSKDADVLLLGDSFANIFSVEAMGWGESAGFAEHLSRALGQPAIDCILRNSDGAFATRELLSRELAKGRDRLAGKKVVVWEFAARELAFGNWKLLDMKLGQPQPARFFNPKPGEEVMVTGTVEAVSPVPRPGSVPYADHIFAVHLVDVATQQPVETEGLQAVVYLWSMRDNVRTRAARLRPGDRITLRLRAWFDVSAQNEKFNRSELDDPALQQEEPGWGELVN